MNDGIERHDADVRSMVIKEWANFREHMDKQLLKLEVQYNDQELMNDLLSSIQMIKRGSSFAGMMVIRMIAYEIELVFHAIRERAIEVHSEHIDCLLSAIEVLNDGIQHFREHIQAHDSIQPSNEFTSELAIKNQWHEIGFQLHELFMDKNKQSAIETSNEAEGAESLPLELADKAINNASVKQFKAPHIAAVPEPMQKAVLPQSIRVKQEKLDKMMNMIAELLIAKNAFMHVSKKLNVEYDLPELSKEVKEVGFSFNRISDELQNTMMSIRMVEVKTIFQKMPRIIRDVVQLTGKKMELITMGEHTEIDKTIVEQISDPIVHLIRNAADHGIESSEERIGKGKSETGRITLRAYNKDKHVYIEIEDDGKGIDAAVMKQKAIARGFITAEQAIKMTNNQMINLIFLPGFSTAGQITEVSGRGVGMDIAKSNIEKNNGSISIYSEMNKGTKMVIQLPLTLAISRGLIINVAQETYMLPIDYIAETVKINAKDIHEFDGKYMAAFKGEVIGIEWLSKLLLLGERSHQNDAELNTVVIANGNEKFGIIVDKLKNEQEFVIKTFNGHLAGIPGISGSTLLGNGQVVLIINPIDLIQLAKN